MKLTIASSSASDRPSRPILLVFMVGPIFRVVRKPRIGRGSDVAGGEVREQRVFAGPAVPVTVVAVETIGNQRLVAGQLMVENRVRAELPQRQSGVPAMTLRSSRASMPLI
jgi:hypothetical protein